MSNKLQDHEKKYNEKKLSYFEFNNLVYLYTITDYLIDIDKRLITIDDKLEGVKSNTELLASKEI